jgi:YceI-like protein
MQVFGSEQSDCFVYVYREGALSAVGHDLKLRVTDFRIEVGEEPAVRAELRADSLRVVGVLRGGAVDDREPGERDRREIEENIRRDVLESERYPVITFRSLSVARNGDGARVTGRLDLHGVVRDIELPVRWESGRAVARVRVHQPDFGIKPFRALLGALRVKPDVLVEAIVPIDPGSAPAAAS